MNLNPTDAKEQYDLSFEYSTGILVPEDMDKAAYWITKAAENGYLKAQKKLAYNYETGQDGFPIDREKMKYWYTKAAEQGDVDAQYTLGLCYSTGIFVSGDISNADRTDYDKARYWYGKAAAQGHKDAKKSLKRLNSSFCYVATAVYGSYDCPEVWALRRFRDSKLIASWFGRRFISVYYATSPKIIELFGNRKWFNRLCKPVLNRFVCKLQKSGIESSPYSDMQFIKEI